jgi:hypothetical protein
MGEGVKIKESIDRRRARRLVMDTSKGTVVPKPDPEDEEKQSDWGPAAEPAQVASYTFD